MSKQSKRLEDDLSLPLDIETEHWKRLSGNVLILICGAIAALVAIAAFAPVREVAIAKGELVTSIEPVVVEHFEGGTVEDIHVRPGDVVEPGMRLITIAPGTLKSELSRSRIRRAFLAAQRARLLAHMRGDPLDLDWLTGKFPDLARNEEARFAAERAQLAAEEEAISAEIESLMAERNAAQREIDSVQAQISIDEERTTIQAQLAAQGLATRTAMLEARSRAETVRADLAAAEKAHSSASRAIADARYRLTGLRSTRLQEWTLQDAELSAEMVELDATTESIEERLDDRIVTVSEGGVVHELAVNGSGEVVAPGDLIATIIPVGATLVAEVKVKPEDIGHIETGLPAEVIVTTFDKEVYGSVEAAVHSISPTTFTSPEEEPFYRVRLTFDVGAVRHGENVGELLPGMVVQSEILTGDRSLLKYMLKPLLRAFDRAFTER